MVDIGDKAPDFSLKDHNGEQQTLREFNKDKIVVLHIFPAAFTGG
jgi:peroxiredoxin